MHSYWKQRPEKDKCWECINVQMPTAAPPAYQVGMCHSANAAPCQNDEG